MRLLNTAFNKFLQLLKNEVIEVGSSGTYISLPGQLGICKQKSCRSVTLQTRPDPAAVARFAFDVDHVGRFTVPVISAHGIGDATVFVEGSDTLRQRMAVAGNGQRLVQNFVDSAEHSYWGDAYYPPLFNDC